jgi:hypothetical protein
MLFLCFSKPDLSEKRLNTFHFGSFFYNLNNNFGKTKSANDLKICTKISGLTLHQMVHLSGNYTFSPIISKNLSGVPLNMKMVKW